MAKDKSISRSTPTFAAGGHGNHMLGKTGAVTQTPNTTVSARGAGGGFAKGGSGHMVGPQKSTPAKAH